MQLNQNEIRQENFILKEQLTRLSRAKQILEEEFSIWKRESQWRTENQNAQIAELDQTLQLRVNEEEEALLYIQKQMEEKYQERETNMINQIEKLKDALAAKETMRNKQKEQQEDKYLKLREEVRLIQTDNVTLKLSNEKLSRNLAELLGEKKQKEKMKEHLEELIIKLNQAKAHSASLRDLINQIKAIAIERGFADHIIQLMQAVQI